MPCSQSCCVVALITLAGTCTAEAQIKHLTSVTPSPKQAPVVKAFRSCRADGNYGTAHTDRAENHLKNRTDRAADYPLVEPTAITELKNFNKLKGSPRENWRLETLSAVQVSEGIPVTLDGFLADDPAKRVHGATTEGDEATNCGRTTDADVDWHGWLVAKANGPRSTAIVVEFTPRVRASHSGWTIDKLHAIAKRHLLVRVSGWTLFDPEHPEQLKKTRKTLWEIHPVMDVKVKSGAQWVALDSWTP